MADLNELQTLLAAAYPGPYEVNIIGDQAFFYRMNAEGFRTMAFAINIDPSDTRLTNMLYLLAHSWDFGEIIPEIIAARDQVAAAELVTNRINPVIEGVLRMCRENPTITWSQVPVKIRARLQELWQLFQAYEAGGA